MPIENAEQLRNLYIRQTNSKDVAASFAPWHEVPQLVRDAWEEVLAAAREDHPDKKRLDWLEGEMDRELKAIAAGTMLVCNSLFRMNVPITRELIDERTKP